jgi:hypothetical protein
LLLPLPAGERDGVRGVGYLSVERAQNLFEHTVNVPHHVVVPESDHEISEGFEFFGSLIFTCALRMLAAVKFDD